MQRGLKMVSNPVGAIGGPYIRKVIQLVAWNNWLVALCDDGTMWGYPQNAVNGQWVQMASIPQ